jgi:hypothetical protein
MKDCTAKGNVRHLQKFTAGDRTSQAGRKPWSSSQPPMQTEVSPSLTLPEEVDRSRSSLWIKAV